MMLLPSSRENKRMVPKAADIASNPEMSFVGRIHDSALVTYI